MLQSRKLLNYPELIHGFSTRQEGDLRDLERASSWLASLSLKKDNLVLAEQIHQDKIALVGGNDKGKKIKGVDGLLTKDSRVLLGVQTADCLPIIFWEPRARIVGIVHAGWRGTLLRISQKMVKKIASLGGRAKNIIASFGPHIGMCCYDVPYKRAHLFEEKFAQDPRLVSVFEGKPHLDLAFVNFLQLLEFGLIKDNLEAPPSCTRCQKNLFFSFRRSQREADEYGEMLAVIGIKP